MSGCVMDDVDTTWMVVDMWLCCFITFDFMVLCSSRRIIIIKSMFALQT